MNRVFRHCAAGVLAVAVAAAAAAAAAASRQIQGAYLDKGHATCFKNKVVKESGIVAIVQKSKWGVGAVTHHHQGRIAGSTLPDIHFQRPGLASNITRLDEHVCSEEKAVRRRVIKFSIGVRYQACLNACDWRWQIMIGLACFPSEAIIM